MKVEEKVNAAMPIEEAVEGGVAGVVDVMRGRVSEREEVRGRNSGSGACWKRAVLARARQLRARCIVCAETGAMVGVEVWYSSGGVVLLLWASVLLMFLFCFVVDGGCRGGFFPKRRTEEISGADLEGRRNDVSW